MQAAEVRDLNDPANARDLPSVRTLLRHSQMRPRLMVIGKIRIKSALEMPRVQDHEMVQALSSDRANEAFSIRILPGTADRRERLFNV